MMVKVIGVNDPEHASIIERLARFILSSYFTGEETAKFDITIKSDISLLEKDRLADCTVLPGQKTYPTCFEIGILTHGVSFMEQMQCVSHECVHVKQFHTGEFDVLDSGRVFRWQDRVVCVDDIEDWEEPWELDARSMEKAWVEKFVKAFNLKKAPWYHRLV